MDWISVKDALPQTPDSVLATDGSIVDVAGYTNGEWFISYWGPWDGVTHWMPLPEPPGFKGCAFTRCSECKPRTCEGEAP